MSRSESIRFVIVRSFGNFLLLFAIYGVLATFGPALYYEVQYQVIVARGITFRVQETSPKAKIQPFVTPPVRQSGPAGPGFAAILAGPKEQILLPKDTQFSIVIPKIAASAKIFSNVDPNNPSEFLPILQQGIAHAKGSVFPGMNGNIYLFAHSTDSWLDVGRYNAVFYLLHDLVPGDSIVLFFDNKRYDYVVAQSLIIDPTDISLIARDHNGPERLVLQTCWPPGTALQRYYIIAVPKGSADTVK